MKRIGIVGGLSPESTLAYYRLLISLCRERGLGHSTPVVIIYSVNFEECMNFMATGQTEELITYLGGTITALHRAGADFAIISANTPHIVFDEVAARSPVPLLSIVEETGKETQRLGLKKVGLFGTGITMREHFYPKTFMEKFNITIAMPDESEQNAIHHSIMNELTAGLIRPETRQKMVDIAERMIREEEIEGLILGCTELPIILSGKDVRVPVLDTTRIHVQATLAYAMS